MSERSTFLNTFIDNLTMKETIDLVNQSIKSKTQLHHTVINAGKVVAMHKNVELRESVNNSDIINADGQAIVWGARILGEKIKERVAGIDLMNNLVELASENNYKIYLLGAKEEVVSKLVDIYSNKYGQQIIAGYRNGYFRQEEEKEIIQDIANSGANMLFVAISSPIKENLLFKYREELKAVNFIMGVGGSFDVITGKVKRAPIWMQKSGLEWFYRFLQEPQRMWKRYLIGNTKFIALVLKEKLKKQH
jgi:N-acetylglucosaminyldiphosphoundecaprenol N-acetyl-beta-D-mannosaminyltransferase